MVGDAQDLANSEHTMHKIRLIDYGLCTKYVDHNGQHIEQKKEQKFLGNTTFASINSLNLVSLGRRDDLISLCYILLYIIDGNIIFLDVDPNLTDIKKFKRIRRMKNRVTPEILCG